QKGEPREEVQVGPDRWADEGKERMDRLPIQGVEIDRLFKEAKGDGGALHVKDDGVSNVGNGDAVSDARRFEGLSSQEDLKEKFSIHYLGQPHGLDDRAQDAFAVVASHPVEDASDLKRFGEAHEGGRAVLRFCKDLGGDVDS